MSEQKLVSVNGENVEKQIKDREARRISLGRHQAQCLVCKHPQRMEIEEDFVCWTSARRLEMDYEVNRWSMHRHALAFDLYSKRRRESLMVLEQIMERVDWTPVNGRDILAAFKLHAKICGAEREAGKADAPNLEKVLDPPSQVEREALAVDGSPTESSSMAKAAPLEDSQELDKGRQVTENTTIQ